MTHDDHADSRGDLPKLGAPARRALDSAGYTRLEQLNGVSVSEIARLHGIGKHALSALRQALAVQGMAFADEEFE